LDEYVIVPNHIHGVIIIRLCENNKAKSGLDKSGLDKSGFDKSNPYRILIPNNPMLMPRDTLGKIIRYYKAKSAYLIRNVYGYRCFSWQSRYYDRIIWDKFGLERVRNYIRNHKKLLDRS
jgi:REP element-mobilizing transposase RayT